MIDNFIDVQKNLLKKITQWEKEHPYQFSFIVSVTIVLYCFFYTTSLSVSDQDLMATENIVFLDIEKYQAPKFKSKKDFTKDDLNVTDDTSNIERAEGFSDDENAVDLAFFPSVTPPKLIGKLKKNYPKIGKDQGIEATVNVDLLITSSGKVKRVDILGIRLSKNLPPEKSAAIIKDFSREAIKSLLRARFTPTIIKGKQSPIKWNITLEFQLE